MIVSGVFAKNASTGTSFLVEGWLGLKVNDSVRMHDIIAENYTRILQSASHQAHAREISRILPINEADVVLDVGAGIGRIAKVMLENHNIETYYALEPGELALHFIVRHPRLKLLRERGQDISLRDDTCDLTFAEQVLIHVKGREEQVKILREMRRVTKPGGFVCLTTTPCYGRLLTSYFRLIDKREIYFKAKPKSEDGEDVFLYRRRYSIDEIKSLITTSGLRLLRIVPRMRVFQRYHPMLSPIFRLFGLYDHVIAQVP